LPSTQQITFQQYEVVTSITNYAFDLFLGCLTPASEKISPRS